MIVNTSKGEDLMKRILLIVILIIVFSGCRNHIKNATNNITPFGLDTYTITYNGRNYSSVRTIVHKAANQYCQEQGKVFFPKNENQKTGFRNNIVELIFRCLQPDDPELNRPEWETRPDTVIEDRRRN